MRSKAQFKTHPLHPVLIPFPIAFLIGARARIWSAVFGTTPDGGSRDCTC
jgi:uncharacterized membrane protein